VGRRLVWRNFLRRHQGNTPRPDGHPFGWAHGLGPLDPELCSSGGI